MREIRRPLLRLPLRLPRVLLALLLLTALPALAVTLPVTLDEAKDAGEVGEQPNGYLGVVRPPASEEIRTLVDEVNAARRERYRQIAEKNDIELRQVEMLAGKKAIEKTESGDWVRLPDGSWVPK